MRGFHKSIFYLILSYYCSSSHRLHITSVSWIQQSPGCYTRSVSHSPWSIHIPTPLALQCSSSVQSLSVSSSRRVLFIPSLRELQSAIAFMVSIAASSLVQSLLTALQGTCLSVVLVPAYQMTEDYNIRSDKTQLCCFSPVMLWQIIIVSSTILHEITFTA